jgi:nucleoside-diphosphate-sugar epimerase
MLDLRRAAILGATGPAGRHLVAALLARGVQLRVIGRSAGHLAQAFGALPVERAAADARDPEAAARAIGGCDVAFNAIGLPLAEIADHPVIARSIAAALRATGAHGVQISSFWAFLPARRLPLAEDHPRTGGNPLVQQRRAAEDILRQAGAAIVNLPDFYGPKVRASTLQRALAQAAAGQAIRWIGRADTPREYVFLPDAMAAVAELARHERAYGEHWIVAGAGPITIAEIARIAGRHLGRPVRGAHRRSLLLRLASLVNPELRAFRPMLPDYLGPIRYDGAKLRGLLAAVPTTPYEPAIPATLDGLAAPREAADAREAGNGAGVV